MRQANTGFPIVAYLTANCTLTYNADFTASGGIATASTGGVVAGICPDTILVTTAATTVILTLPKIGTQGCPVGSTVSVRKLDAAGAGLVTVTGNLTGASDTVDGNATAGALVFPASAMNTATVRACSITAGVFPQAGQWRTIASSVAGI